MKKGCMGINVAVPEEAVHAMARLNGGNRTTTVNLAIKAYLDVQGPSVNRYGVDCDYFRNKLQHLASRLDNYTDLELRRAFLQLEAAVRGDTLNDERERINEEV